MRTQHMQRTLCNKSDKQKLLQALSNIALHALHAKLRASAFILGYRRKHGQTKNICRWKLLKKKVLKTTFLDSFDNQMHLLLSLQWAAPKHIRSINICVSVSANVAYVTGQHTFSMQISNQHKIRKAVLIYSKLNSITSTMWALWAALKSKKAGGRYQEIVIIARTSMYKCL